jgi:hypothetical protein
MRVSARCALVAPAVRVVGGSLPDGMGIDHRGAWVGTPTQPGDFSVEVELTDGCFRRRQHKTLRVTPAPVFSLDAEKLEFHIVQGAPPFSAGIVRVSGAPEQTPYSVDIAGARFLRAEMRDGALPHPGSALEADILRVSIDAEKLAPGTHTATLRLSAWRAANTPELRYVVHVAPAMSALPKVELQPPQMPERIVVIEIPQSVTISPPVTERPPLPAFPKHKPKSKPPSHSGNSLHIRSRVLPIPKVTLPAPAAAKPAAPERTKPSAMPPPAKPEKH